MKMPRDIGFKANPFPQHGVPPKVKVPFATYPSSDLHEVALEKWLKSIYKEKRPSCYIFVGEFGSGKSHLCNIIRDLAQKNGYDVKEEFFSTSTSLYSTISKTNFKEKRIIILFDEIQGLYDQVRKNPDALSNFKVELRNFLEGKWEARTEEGFSNVTIILFCTPQVKNVILREEDMSQRFMLTVKQLPYLEPYIGLSVAKNFLKAYADKEAEARMRINPYYPFDRYAILSLINLCPYVVEKKGAAYRPTTRFLIELLRHCFDYMLENNLNEFTFKDIPSALRETRILEMTFDLSPRVYRVEEVATSPQGKSVANFFGTALGWWTIYEISKACGIPAQQVKEVIQNELSSIINAEKCWIIHYGIAEKHIKDEIKKLGRRYEEKIEDIFSVPWVTLSDEPCYLVIPSLHLIDEQIERIFKKYDVKQEDIYWLKNTMEVFHVSLEGKFKRFSSEQLEVLREFLTSDSLRREQEVFGKLKEAITHARLKERSILEPYDECEDSMHRIIGLKVMPHISAQDIYYRVGLKFMNIPPSGIVDREFRDLIEYLKSSPCDFIILFTYPELAEYDRLRHYMQEKVKWAPANKRIFIKNLTEFDLVSILTDPSSFSITLEDLILDAIRDFNEGMLNENLLMPLYGLRQAMRRLNPNYDDCIFPKIREKWFRQVYESIKDSSVREFIAENYRKPADQIEFGEGEIIRELFDSDMNLIISEYERKVYELLRNYYRIGKQELRDELNKVFVVGALHKLSQAGLTPYDFIVEFLLTMKNLVKILPEYDVDGKQKLVIITRKIDDEKQSVISLIEEVQQSLRKEIKITFEGKTYTFTNERYISKTLDKLELIEAFVKGLPRVDEIYEKARILTQLSFIIKALENIRTKPEDEFSSIVQRIKDAIETINNAEKRIIDELIKYSFNFTPFSCKKARKIVKKTLQTISNYVKEGKLLDLVEREIKKLEKFAEKFDEECSEVASMMINIDSEIYENNEKSKYIQGIKQKASLINKKIDRYKLNEYFEITSVSLEKNSFRALQSFLRKVDSLQFPRNISENERKLLIQALEKVNFNKVLEKYKRKIKSVLEETVKINVEYSDISREFIEKTEMLISKLANFWPPRIEVIENEIYSLKTSTDGISRAECLIEVYHKLLSVAGTLGLKIAHAMACGLLNHFLFIDNIENYSSKLGMTKQEFLDGLKILKTAKILREGLG